LGNRRSQKASYDGTHCKTHARTYGLSTLIDDRQFGDFASSERSTSFMAVTFPACGNAWRILLAVAP
jgi:hypothetical protein